MTERVKSAFSGDQHIPVPAPQWDYDGGQKIAFSGTAAASQAIDAPLVRIVATEDCYYRIGGGDAANAAGSVFLAGGINWAETITLGDVISVISDGTDGSLFIIPAKMEGGA